MIVNNHYIEFESTLEIDKTTSGSYSDIITIKKSMILNLSNSLDNPITFYNNQGRTLCLYTETFTRTKPTQQWIFDVEGVVTFSWYSGEMIIEYLPKENFTSKLLEYWTLHILLPIFLTIEEHCYFLHAGAVEIDDSAVLFVAESFGGKSTITDFFIKQGHAMVSDDKVAILEEDGKFLAVPSHPHHRPYRNMEDLGIYVENMADSPKPISNIYTLHRVASEAPISIRELHGIEKFKSLRFSTEINLSFLKSQRLKDLGHVAENIPVYKVSVPWDLERLDEVYTAILNHIRTES